jgi:cytochrome c-type biogenesis protein CcmE
VSRRRALFLGIGGIAVLVIVSLGDNITYYLYPTEAVQRRVEFPDGERFRLAGVVVPGSVHDGEEDMTFEVSDGGATIPITLTSAPPPLFAEDVPVLLEGAWSGERFVASTALIRHDENYTTPEEGGTGTGDFPDT